MLLNEGSLLIIQGSLLIIQGILVMIQGILVNNATIHLNNKECHLINEGILLNNAKRTDIMTENLTSLNKDSLTMQEVCLTMKKELTS